MALAARRFGGEDVVQADEVGLLRELPAGHHLAVELHLESLERHGRVRQPLAVGLALRQR